MRKVNDSKNIFVFAYEMSPDQYKKLLRDTITKSCKTCNDEVVYDEINEELRDICKHFSIGNRINTMTTKDAFITIKDHKEDFQSNLKCRLINPTKSNLGKISKVILDEINDKIRAKLNSNQWKNSQTVIEWFKNINEKSNHTFVSFDIVEFYPSITEELLDRVIEWAKSITRISNEYISIIKHARKSLLFSGETPWVKRSGGTMFDLTMGSYDGAEV